LEKYDIDLQDKFYKLFDKHISEYYIYCYVTRKNLVVIYSE